MKFSINHRLMFDKEVLEDETLNDSTKKDYLYAMATSTFPLKLIQQLETRGHFCFEEKEMWSYSKEPVEVNRFISVEKPQDLEFIFGFNTLNGEVLEDFELVFCSKSSSFQLKKVDPKKSSLSSNRQKICHKTQIFYKLLQNSSSNSKTSIKIKNIEFDFDNINIIIRHLLKPLSSRKYNGHPVDLGTYEDPKQTLKDKITALKNIQKQRDINVKRKRTTDKIMFALELIFTQYEMEDTLGLDSLWKDKQRSLVRKALREKPNIKSETWVEAMKWFAAQDFWRGNFFNSGFRCVHRNIAHFLT